MDNNVALAQDALRPQERRALYFWLAVIVLWGVLVEIRSVGVFEGRRMGDIGCYLRGAWAVYAGEDIYDVTCDNVWHYNYPPLLAILMVPFADAPKGASVPGLIPYAVSVAFWYVFSLACLVLSVHWLASALEENSPDPAVRTQPRFCRRWWALRLWPALVCLVPIGHTLMRGQVNLLLLALLCGMMASMIRGQHFRAGLFMAGPICIKIYPAFLLVYPLWNRNWRCVAGCALGLFVGLIAVPGVTFGPARTVAIYEKYADVLLSPALAKGSDDTRMNELIGVNATWSQSFKVVAHKTIYRDSDARPQQIAPWLEWAHKALGMVLTLLALMVAGQSPPRATTLAFQVGALALLMNLLCPVCHMHYLCLALPLVVALIARRLEGQATLGLGLGLTALLGAFVVGNLLPQLWMSMRDLGSAMYVAMAVWFVAIYQAWKSEPAAAVPVPDGPSNLRGVLPLTSHFGRSEPA